MRKSILAIAGAVVAFALGSAAYAGPFIIDGTDADDHGSASGGQNLAGWLYIQRGLENIAGSASLTRTQKTIAVLGSDAGTQAALAVQSAVNLSSTLQAAGWQVVLLNNAGISNFFSNTGSGLTSNNASVIYMDSTDNNVTGGINSAEQAIIDANATAINNFVGSGGGLFSHAQGYGWLSALIPGLTVLGESNTGIALTAAGQASFPGLTNSDLSAGPYHERFANTGAVPILGTSISTGNAIILGGGGGSITNPTTGNVPEPATWAMMIGGFGMVGTALRRSRRTIVRFA